MRAHSESLPPEVGVMEAQLSALVRQHPDTLKMQVLIRTMKVRTANIDESTERKDEGKFESMASEKTERKADEQAKREAKGRFVRAATDEGVGEVAVNTEHDTAETVEQKAIEKAESGAAEKV